jgi:ribosomal protein S18 acetylase RimI-like enzyme
VALALLRSVFASLRDRGITRVGLEVDDITLHGALRLYERAGMRVARRTDVVEKVL